MTGIPPTAELTRLPTDTLPSEKPSFEGSTAYNLACVFLRPPPLEG